MWFFPGPNIFWAFLVAQTVKNWPAIQDTQVPSLDWEDPLEKGMANQYSCLQYPMIEEPGALQSMRLQRVRHNWVTFIFNMFLISQFFILQEKYRRASLPPPPSVPSFLSFPLSLSLSQTHTHIHTQHSRHTKWLFWMWNYSLPNNFPAKPHWHLILDWSSISDERMTGNIQSWFSISEHPVSTQCSDPIKREGKMNAVWSLL